MKTHGWMAATMAAWMAAHGSAGAYELTITVAEPAGLARTAEPVSGGIPLPLGQFKADQSFALYDGAQEMPLQVSPLVVEPDGTLRWILLDFQTDLNAGEKKAFTLKTGIPSARPASPLKVVDSATAVVLDTGRFIATIAKNKPFALFDSVTANGTALTSGGTATYTDPWTEKTYTAGPPSSVDIEYQGPMRATVAVKGRFVGDDQNRFGYIARITVWAGSPRAHAVYKLTNSNPDHYTYRQVRESAITLTLATAPDSVTLGASKAMDAGNDGWLHQGLNTRVKGAARAGRGDDELWVSQGPQDIAQGWIGAKVGQGQVYATDLYFSEDPARRLELTGQTLKLAGVAPRYVSEEKDKKGREVGVPYRSKDRWLMDCSHLRSEYLLDFGNGDNAELWRLGRHRLHALASPLKWYSDSEALPLGRFGTQADELTSYRQWEWAFDDKSIPSAPRRTYGRYMAGEDNHFETEQDSVEVMLMMYLRTGARAFFDHTETWANYNLDLQTWRCDGWRWKDGGVWWRTGPLGNRPQREKDPVADNRNAIPAPWTKEPKGVWAADGALQDIYFLANAKSCHCHNWGGGLAGWYLITGDRDALEATINQAEMNIDFFRRARRGEPGKVSSFSRDFTRGLYVCGAARLIAPTDPFLIEASDFLFEVYRQRPNPEPRGFVNGPGRHKGLALEKIVGAEGVAAMEAAGVRMDPNTSEMTDKEDRTWLPVYKPNIWMHAPMSMAMDLYYRLSGNEDAMDFVIAYAQAVSRVMWQRHGHQHPQLLGDFPTRGVFRDFACWTTPPENTTAEGVRLSGYLGGFHPDVAANGYTLSGEPLLKQRAYDYWFNSSHRRYQATQMHNIGQVGQWVNFYGPHSESVLFTGRTFDIWAQPRADTEPPPPVADLKVAIDGDKAVVSFTAPPDAGGGTVARFQVKCAGKPIVDYETFLDAFNNWRDDGIVNWWMATNLHGEPAGRSGPVSFEVHGVPEDAKYFAVRLFDDSHNRSAISNVAKAR